MFWETDWHHREKNLDDLSSVACCPCIKENEAMQLWELSNLVQMENIKGPNAESCGTSLKKE